MEKIPQKLLKLIANIAKENGVNANETRLVLNGNGSGAIEVVNFLLVAETLIEWETTSEFMAFAKDDLTS